MISSSRAVSQCFGHTWCIYFLFLLFLGSEYRVAKWRSGPVGIHSINSGKRTAIVCWPYADSPATMSGPLETDPSSISGNHSLLWCIIVYKQKLVRWSSSPHALMFWLACGQKRGPSKHCCCPIMSYQQHINQQQQPKKQQLQPASLMSSYLVCWYADIIYTWYWYAIPGTASIQYTWYTRSWYRLSVCI